ncbi:MAG: phosphoribosylamine--glycine ligase [Alphaproteobacteria bacterium]|nr:phosphoribosylamine--glycine ligase [Alphaproteobacteria bacterium]
MNILVLGSGGREHALCWKIAQSPLLGQLYCAPGNGGIAQIAHCVNFDMDNLAALVQFCHEQQIALVVIGPEALLAAGLADILTDAGIAVFGPSAKAAQLESSKGFTKSICAEYNIPTAAYGWFDKAADAHAYLQTHPAPIVVKADGLAAGKGVILAETDEEARVAVDKIFSGGFGAAGASVVIEEFMQGEEASFFALCDGTHALPLATAQDHKRVGDGDIGLNTGGMGAYSPAPIMSDELIAETLTQNINPTLQAMSDKGIPYKGVLYAGLMLTQTGIKLVEYNVRFGDPECQVLMARLQSDIVPALMAVAKGDIRDVQLEWAQEVALTVVMAADGYPESVKKGSEIKGLDKAAIEGVTIFHAGTKIENGKYIANGGRVLNITSMGESVAAAQKKAYQTVEAIDWPEGFCRRDIGWRAIARETKVK